MNLSLSDESPDGSLVVGMNWGELVVADAVTGSVLDTQSISTGPLHSVRFQDDNQTLLLASRNDRELRSFSRKTREVQKAYQVKKSLSAVAINSEKTSWITADASGEIRMWGTSAASEPLSRTDSESGCKFAQFLPATSEVLLARDDATSLWSPTSNEERPFSDLRSVQRAAKDGSILVGLHSTTNSSTTLEIWNRNTDVTSSITVPYSIYQNCLALSRSGRWLATRGEGKSIELFDLTTKDPRPIHSFDARCFGFAFSPDEKLLVGGVQYGEVCCFEVESGKRLKNYAEWQSFWAWGMGCAFSPDSKYVACGNESGTIHVWNTHTRELITRLTGNQGEVLCIAFFPDGKRLVSGGTGDIRLWDFQAGQEIMSMQVPDQRVVCVSVNDQGDAVLALSPEGHVSVWKAH